MPKPVSLSLNALPPFFFVCVFLFKIFFFLHLKQNLSTICRKKIKQFKVYVQIEVIALEATYKFIIGSQYYWLTIVCTIVAQLLLKYTVDSYPIWKYGLLPVLGSRICVIWLFFFLFNVIRKYIFLYQIIYSRYIKNILFIR